MPNEYFVFSALASITGGGSATNATQKIQARLTDGVDGNVILAELDFDPSQRTKQVQATTVCLNRGVHNLAVKLLISGTTASITLKDVRLTVASGGAQTEVSTLNTRMQNFSEHSSAGVKVWYKAAPVNLIAEHSKIELLSEVKFTVKDFNLTKLSYIKNPQKFNVWYNDGADLLYGVSALSVRSSDLSGTSLTISSLNYGTVTESIGTKTFTYMLPIDTAGEYKVVTAIDDGTTAYKVNNNTRSLETEETLEYNWLGNITKYGNVRYFYDRLGRLTREDNPAIDKTITWMYNSDNSPTQRVVYPYTTGTLGDPVDTWTFTYGTACREQITGFNGQTITYGRAGEAINYRNMRFSWIRGKLLGTIKATDLTLTLTYNGEGLRDGKDVTTTNGTKHHSYYYADGHLVCETCKDVPDTGVNFIVQYFYNQQGIVAMCYGGSHYMFRKNFFGDIIGIYDWENNCVAKYAYDAYGVCKVMNPDGTENTDEDFIGNINPIRYRGYYYDVGTGFYYLQTRYYDPQTGRFLNMDGLEYLDPETVGGLNLYAYCNGNPVMYVDPTGTAWWHWLIVGGLAIASIVIITASIVSTIAVSPIAIAAAAGYLIGSTSNTIDQLQQNGYDITKVDPIQVLSNGAWSAFTSAMVAGFSTVATNIVGGFAGEFATRFAQRMSCNPEFISTVTEIFTWIGNTLGITGVSLYFSHIANEATGNEQSFGEMMWDNMRGNVSDFIKDRLKELIRLKIKGFSK